MCRSDKTTTKPDLLLIAPAVRIPVTIQVSDGTPHDWSDKQPASRALYLQRTHCKQRQTTFTYTSIQWIPVSIWAASNRHFSCSGRIEYHSRIALIPTCKKGKKERIEHLFLLMCHLEKIRCQFHQHFTYTFFVRTSFRQLFF